MSGRRFVDASSEERCQWTIRLRGGGKDDFARCGRHHVDGQLCTQHAKMAAAWSCEYCGGNDELPPDHTMDCTRPTDKPDGEAEPSAAAVQALIDAAKSACQFIRNGVEWAYIQMPDGDTPDSARQTLPKLEAALAALSSHPKEEGEALDARRAALRKLIDCKDMEARLHALQERGHGTDWDDLRRRLWPEAWEAARAALGIHPLPEQGEGA